MTPKEQIDNLISETDGWRGETLANIRRIILGADPEIIEEWKWMGTPVWSKRGIVCIANAFKDKVKMTFHQGAHLPDPHHLFNNGLDGNKWRTIDYFEGDKIKESELKELVRAAVDYNLVK
ncbi:MAG: DUF1801 domain-containing protein [Patescibacteria group bacterium]|jgi:hypothetical protein